MVKTVNSGRTMPSPSSFPVCLLTFFSGFSSGLLLSPVPVLFASLSTGIFFGLLSSSDPATGCWSFEGDSTVHLLCFTLPLVFFSLCASSVSPLFSGFFFFVFSAPSLSVSLSLSCLPLAQDEDDGDKGTTCCWLNGSSLLCVFSFSSLC